MFFKEVSRVLKMFQGYFKKVSNLINRNLKGVSRKFQGCFKKFQGCFTEVLRVFQGKLRVSSRNFHFFYGNINVGGGG